MTDSDNTSAQAISGLLHDIFLSKFSEPPTFLLIAGLLTSLACAAPFIAILRQQVKTWSNDSASNRLPKWGSLQLSLPFIGIWAGVSMLLVAIFGLLGLSPWVSFGLALALAYFLGTTVWFQIGQAIGQRIVRSMVSESNRNNRRSREQPRSI
ncbi:hypothetical protein [Leptolyngbya sp. FACHB-261]|uniref:hypothetical protein n=1 Tax=Leptolyngbya sp. FACHB-261 TaxID=2692806 RepID=UPI0016838E02|nr:hypothetical protein [Leptolyngbya sp. FACHB-261]MBD2103693.1 hypothetical protein [Leptolyngbya sp. FACHB-261]